MVEVSVVSRFHRDDADIIAISDLLNRAWVPHILHRLDYYGKLRFNQIKRSVKGISSTSLSRTLFMLEERNIVSREVHNTRPLRVEYSLTERGKELSGIVSGMLGLGRKWNEARGEAIEVRHQN